MSGGQPEKYSGVISGELTIKGRKNISLVHSQPYLSDDSIIVVLKDALILEQPKLNIELAQTIDENLNLTLVGYQDLATRNDLLNDVSANMEPAKNPRSYLNNIKFDNSPLCFKGPNEDGGFHHFCQSMSGMSGAPLIIGNLADAVKNDAVTIAGVLSGGNTSIALELEKQGAPNKAALVRDDLIDALRKMQAGSLN